MKPTPIEKFQYLVHLKASNVHLFYRLLSENIKVRVDRRTSEENFG
jgi:malate dehydrogenase (oxaloacetate-decarboxylating)(NADP+)